ncbi:MAG: MaoC family dehydratase N-terminal domain-containing protein [Chloroflexi bacterium]|nr:MaoC family dehydratase N-terminal domain-containing protein [Chloroflexota bacterium]
MVQESLITDEARAQIGKVTRRTTGVVYLKEAQRWAAAVGDRNPIYFDEEAARAAGYEGIPIPPMFLPHVLHGVADLSNLRADGIPGGGGGQRLPLKVNRMMYGGEELEFYEPVYPGDTITAEGRVASIEQKEGSKGPFVLTTNETTYTNQDGRVVGKSRSFSIAR